MCNILLLNLASSAFICFVHDFFKHFLKEKFSKRIIIQLNKSNKILEQFPNVKWQNRDTCLSNTNRNIDTRHNYPLIPFSCPLNSVQLRYISKKEHFDEIMIQ